MNESLRSIGSVRHVLRTTKKQSRSSGTPHQRTGDHTVMALSWPATPVGAVCPAGWQPLLRTLSLGASVIATMPTHYGDGSCQPIGDFPVFSDTARQLDPFRHPRRQFRPGADAVLAVDL